MHFKALLFVSMSFAALTSVTGTARADDDSPSYTMEDVTACSQDAMRICKDKLPDVDAIEGCMKAHYDQLQPKCQARFKR